MALRRDDIDRVEFSAVARQLGDVPCDEAARARVLAGVQAKVVQHQRRKRQWRLAAIGLVLLAATTPALARIGARYDLNPRWVERLFGDPPAPARGAHKTRHRFNASAPARNNAVSSAPQPTVAALDPVPSPLPAEQAPAAPVVIHTVRKATRTKAHEGNALLQPPTPPVSQNMRVMEPNPLLATEPAAPFRDDSRTASPAPPMARAVAPTWKPVVSKPKAEPTPLALQMNEYRSALALSASEPSLALKRLRTLRTTYPQSPLRHEIDIHVLNLLSRANQWSEAKMEARRFLASYPHSVHRLKVQALLDGAP